MKIKQIETIYHGDPLSWVLNETVMYHQSWGTIVDIQFNDKKQITVDFSTGIVVDLLNVSMIVYEPVETTPTWSLAAYFHELRHNPAFHLGLGDIRLTLDMQEEILNHIKP